MLTEEKFKEIQKAIANGDLEYLQVNSKKINIHHSNDYYLYLAVFYKKYTIAQYLIKLGLDPEKTKARLEMADPIGLDKIRKLKKEQLIKNAYQNLDKKINNTTIHTKKLKI
jgi:hypothetical protein